MSNILELFENTVASHADKTAIAIEDQSYSFLELRTIARQMATAIKKHNPDRKPVAVIVQRDIDTIALLLSVVYSGTYYVPIDPEMPAKKMQSILTDCEAEILLDNTNLLATKDNFEWNFQCLSLSDREESETSYEDVPEDEPLYMVYTSGSTGKPKGVLKSHGAVISFIETFANEFHLNNSEIIGNQTPFFFDASAKDLYLMMCTGATLEVIPSTKFIFPVTLVEYMNERRISYVCWVPTALSLVTQMNTFKKVLPKYLKKVLFVGEVFPMKQLRKWLATLPELEYINLYGSSELAGICCYYRIKELGEDMDRLPLGKALGNCIVFLKDGENIITEEGQIGEVCIASKALALEYYHDSEKTAAVFKESILPDGSVDRILCSGDLAQYDKAGNLVFVSRKDFQIKHMGRRIELGEIETAADTIPEIQRCCCLYNDKKKRIELFCELISDTEITGKEIQSTLKGKLSDYMVPNRIHLLDSMPINANGKINRTQLKDMLK